MENSTMVLLLVLGIVLCWRSRLFPLTGIRFILRHTVCTLFQKDRKSENVSPFQALTTALAGTMGVGNIAGVATAVVAGGPGAIFWMWVSAFFGMATKYAEIFLAVRYRKKTPEGQYYGGAMYYIRDGLGRKYLAGAFALLCALCALGVGNMTQINAVSGAMEQSFDVPALWCGLLAALLVALVICGGVKRIGRVTELIIPFLSILYLCIAGVYLYRVRGEIPATLALIVRSAFGFREAASGVLGYSISRAVRLGLSRGVFTNEAGLGSAPIAHASADCDSPARQGAWGVFEVFLDTILVCTITALVILCAGGGTLWQSGLDGAPLTSAAFELAFPDWGASFVSVSIAFYAFAAMTGWCFYGESALRYLCGNRPLVIAAYRVLFLLGIVAGAVAELGFVWRLSDILNAWMAIPNIIALFLLRREIRWGE